MDTLKNYAKIIIIALAVVVFASCAAWGLHAIAAPALPPVVDNAQAAIRSNQNYVKQNQAVVNEYNQRKLNNATQEGILSTYCFSFNYATNTAQKIPDCTPSFQ